MQKKVAKKYSRLRGLAIELGLTHAEIAQAIGISPTSFSNKISGKFDFTIPEMKAICSILKIEPQEIGAYFFEN